MDNLSEVPETPADQVVTGDENRKSVRFDMGSVIASFPQADKRKYSKSPLRVKLQSASRLLFPREVDGSQTAGRTDDREDDDLLLIKEHNFELYLQRVKIDELRYELDERSLAKEVEIITAEISNNFNFPPSPNGGLAFHFSAVIAGHRDFIKYDGTMNQAQFFRQCDKEPARMFKEVRLRFLQVAAQWEVIQLINELAKKMDRGMVVLDDWVRKLEVTHQVEKKRLIENYASGANAFGDDQADARTLFMEQTVELRKLEKVNRTLCKEHDKLVAQVALLSKENDTFRHDNRELRDDNRELRAEVDHLKAKRGKPPTAPGSPGASGSSSDDSDDSDDSGGSSDSDRPSTRGETPSSIRTAPSTTSASGKRSVKTADVPVFHDDETKDTVPFEMWYRMMNDKLTINADHFDTEHAKVAHIMGRLGGQASTNLAPYLRPKSKVRMDTAKKLLKHLFNQYDDPDREETARVDFEKLIMKTSDDFPTFKHKFVRLAGETGLSTRKWKSELERRIPHSVSSGLTAQYLNKKVSFEEYAKMAQMVASKLQRNYASKEKEKSKDKNSDKDKNSSSRTNKGTTATSTGSTRPASTSSTPATITVSGKTLNVRRPSPEKLEAYIREGRCFTCEDKEHTSRDCPFKADVEKARTARVQAIAAGVTAKKEEPASNKDKLHDSEN